MADLADYLVLDHRDRNYRRAFLFVATESGCTPRPVAARGAGISQIGRYRRHAVPPVGKKGKNTYLSLKPSKEKTFPPSIPIFGKGSSPA